MQETHHNLPFLQETLLFLVLAGILIPLLQRLRINQVLGFLTAGMFFGPFGLGLWSGAFPALSQFTFHELDAVSALAELGVLFLMFTIGLELSAERLLAMRRWVFGAGGAQVGITALLIGSIAWLFGNRVEVALILGLVLSLSSTAVAMQIMSERRMVSTPLGRAGFSILMFQDLAVVPLLVLVGILGKGTSDGAASLAFVILTKSLGVIALIYLIGRRLVRPLFHALVKPGRSDVFMALTLLTTLGIGALTAATGLSMALGALLAGLLLAETEFRHEVELTIEPFKGLLMGLFFMSVGMGIDVREVARFPVWLPLSVFGLFAIKSGVIAVIMRLGRLSWADAVQGGLLLGQGGEFAFIVVGYAMGIRFIEAETGQFILLVVGLSLFATPLAAKAGILVGSAWRKAAGAAAAEADAELAALPDRKVIIAGFGRVGKMLCCILQRSDIPCLALEDDATVVARERALDFPVYFGNASRLELLRKVHAERASAIVLTMNHPGAALNAVKAIRREFPGVPLLARALDEKHAVVLKQAGATLVVPETLEASLQLSAFALQALGVAEEETMRVIDEERERHVRVWGLT
ncbi:Kef-type potassium/proton antiporter, CPA2 family [Noviherbaspirillum humi]|uniref:Kef-type potassium/proton antiporter, CPA2 family n=1 Tax=Noviherbaspirillum humi TaxID=1688639 RepID=A0A239M1Q3_9BURK|nr:cation:proton antiporter [Noviherbaspirillum humi]SNT36028.1 Kef-type potassium/proton antiporter, CPA2 family [Noviherbaspirillum humi]